MKGARSKLSKRLTDCEQRRRRGTHGLPCGTTTRDAARRERHGQPDALGTGDVEGPATGLGGQTLSLNWPLPTF